MKWNENWVISVELDTVSHEMDDQMVGLERSSASAVKCVNYIKQFFSKYRTINELSKQSGQQ